MITDHEPHKLCVCVCVCVSEEYSNKAASDISTIIIAKSVFSSIL